MGFLEVAWAHSNCITIYHTPLSSTSASTPVHQHAISLWQPCPYSVGLLWPLSMSQCCCDTNVCMWQWGLTIYVQLQLQLPSTPLLYIYILELSRLSPSVYPSSHLASIYITVHQLQLQPVSHIKCTLWFLCGYLHFSYHTGSPAYIVYTSSYQLSLPSSLTLIYS